MSKLESDSSVVPLVGATRHRQPHNRALPLGFAGGARGLEGVEGVAGIAEWPWVGGLDGRGAWGLGKARRSGGSSRTDSSSTPLLG